MKTATAPPEIEQQPSTWDARIRLGLQMRKAGEEMIAKALADRKATLQNDDLFFRECEDLFGWSRSTVYNHLKPDNLIKDRERAKEKRVRDQENESRRLDKKAELEPEDILTAAEASRATTLTKTAEKDIKEPIDPQIAAAREVRRRCAEHLIRLGHTAAVEELARGADWDLDDLELVKKDLLSRVQWIK